MKWVILTLDSLAFILPNLRVHAPINTALGSIVKSIIETWGGSSTATKFLPTDRAGAVKFEPGDDAPGVEAVLALKLLHCLPIREVLQIIKSETFWLAQIEALLPPNRLSRMYSSRAFRSIFPPKDTDIALNQKQEN